MQGHIHVRPVVTERGDGGGRGMVRAGHVVPSRPPGLRRFSASRSRIASLNSWLTRASGVSGSAGLFTDDPWDGSLDGSWRCVDTSIPPFRPTLPNLSHIVARKVS